MILMKRSTVSKEMLDKGYVKRKTIGYNFSDKHKEYIRKCRNCTFNFAEGAVRAGKTVDNVYAFAHELKTTPDRIHLATGSTMANAKLNIGDCNGLGLEWIFRGQSRWGQYKGNDCLYICGPATRYQTKIVIFAGGAFSDSFKKIRGNSYGMWIATEINLHHDTTIKEAFNRQLAAKRRKVFWDLNPDYPHAPIYSIYIDRYMELDADGKLLGGFNYQNFTIFDNVNITEERKQEIISQYDPTSVWYMRDILGKRVRAEGLVYPMHMEAIQPKPERDPESYVLSVDYGTMNAFSAGLWGLYDGVWWRMCEYYYSGRDTGILKTDEDYAVALDEFTEGIGSERAKLKVIIDPSASSFIVLLRKRGKYRVIQADNAVADGIRETATAMKTGKIKVDPCCKSWIAEVQGYVWDDNSVDERPVKEADHAMDETRYLVKTMNIAKPQSMYVPLFAR